jgi:hypothetical protein
VKKRIALKREQLQSVNLYGEELGELCALFREYCEAFTVADEHFIYETFDEFKNNARGRIKTLEVEGINPPIKVSFDRGGSWITHLASKATVTQEDLDKADLLYLRAHDFLKGHRTGRAKALHGFVICVLVLGIAGGAFLVSNTQRFTPYSSSIIFFGLVSAVGMLILCMTLKHSSGYMTTDARSSVSSFWTRNADKIKMLVVGTIIGVMGTVASQYLVHLIVKTASR